MFAKTFRPTLESLETRDAAASIANPFSSFVIPTAVGVPLSSQMRTTSAPAPTSQAIAGKIVYFAQQNLNRSVDDYSGSRYECTDLVIRALRYAGAKTTYDYGVSGAGRDYVWGNMAVYRFIAPRMYETMGSFSSIRPGDIIQYRNFRNSEGWRLCAPVHSAIVEKNLGNGRIQVLEQNISGHKYVERHVVNLASMTSGTLAVYHPVAR